MHCKTFLCKRILRRIAHACRLIVTDLFNRYTNVFEHLEESFSVMSECYSTVMRESSLNQHVTVETSHLMNGKYTDSTEGTCCNWKNLTV